MTGEKNKTFKGMLKILINDYQKHHEVKMSPLVQELMKAQRELRDVKGKLEELQSRNAPSTSECDETVMPTISLFVQYNTFFNQLCDIQQTITIGNLLDKLRQLTGIPADRCIRLRVLSEDGSTTVFLIEKEANRTLASYEDRLKARMVLNIEDTDEEGEKNDENSRGKAFEWSKSTTSSERTYSFDESDV